MRMTSLGGGMMSTVPLVKVALAEYAALNGPSELLPEVLSGGNVATAAGTITLAPGSSMAARSRSFVVSRRSG